jgi:hypothetical protein
VKCECVCHFVSLHTHVKVTFGARVDSVYEYFLKQHLLGGGHSQTSRELYKGSVRRMMEHLLRKTSQSELMFISERNSRKGESQLAPLMDHLVCFVPGMLILGARANPTLEAWAEGERELHVRVAQGLTRTCYGVWSVCVCVHVFGVNVDAFACI